MYGKNSWSLNITQKSVNFESVIRFILTFHFEFGRRSWINLFHMFFSLEFTYSLPFFAETMWDGFLLAITDFPSRRGIHWGVKSKLQVFDVQTRLWARVDDSANDFVSTKPTYSTTSLRSPGDRKQLPRWQGQDWQTNHDINEQTTQSFFVSS